MTTEPLVAEAPGTRITACARGAHLMTWTTDGVDRLWMSPLSGCGQADALRGGVPVLFPQFATFGSLGKHGFARTTPWQVAEAPDTPGWATLAFELEDSPETLAVWPHPFHARLTVAASSTALELTLTVTNRGHGPAPFTGGLHTYLAVSDPAASIEGLDGCHAWDGVSTASPAFTRRLGPQVAALDTQDLVIRGALAPLVLHDAMLGTLAVSAEGFQHRVVWNPGPGHTLPDVPPGEESRFVCIEAAAVTPIHLVGGSTWEGRQRLSIA